MSQKNKKNLILYLIIAIVFVLILLLNLLKQFTNHNNAIVSESEGTNTEIEFDPNKIEIVQFKSDFILVQSCIEKFYSYCFYNTGKELYNLLDDEYIKSFNITEDNAKAHCRVTETVKIDITDMLVSQRGKKVNAYFCYGYVVDTKNSTITDLAIIVNIDTGNNTFSILPYEYLENKNYLKSSKNLEMKLSLKESIENKEVNTFKDLYISDEEYIEYLFRSYLIKNIFNVDEAYAYLEPEYKEKRFYNLQDFQKFIAKRKDLYISYDLKNAKQYGEFDSMEEYMLYLSNYKPLEIKSYNVSKTSDYTQYVLIDNFGNYYIFRETAPMKYTVILDTYTIDLPEFIEKYNTSNEEEKTILNIQRFLDSINDENYNYAYRCLADSFKNNYFASISSFENYIKNNFPNDFEVSYNKFEKIGEEYCTYSVKITNGTKEITKTFIVKLGEGTEFKLSFDV